MDDDGFNPLALTGLGLDGILSELDLPTSASLPNQLGLRGLDAFTNSQVFSGFAEEGAIGVGEGDDFEDEVDQEIKREEEDDLFHGFGDDDGDVRMDDASTAGKDEAPASPLPDPIVVDEDDDLFGPEPATKRRKKVKKKPSLSERPKDVQDLFPSFEPGKILNFTHLFKSRVVKRPRVKSRPYNVEPVAPKELDPSSGQPLAALIGDAKAVVHRKEARPTAPSANPDTLLKKIINSLADEHQKDAVSSLLTDDRNYDLVMLSDWENQVFFRPPPESALPEIHLTDPDAEPNGTLSNPHNLYLDSDDWLETIIWDAKKPFKDFRNLPFDPEPLRTETVNPPIKTTDIVPRARRRVRVDASAIKDKFNLSNDQYYEVAKDKHRVRQTFGQLVVEHAYPAQKLQLPFYKTRLSKHEARSYHRPALQFPVNLPLSFSKVRGAKKKKDKAGRKITRGDLTEGLRFTGDISLRDTSTFVLMEYSEEYPAVLSNFGMGSVLVNYYRKRNEADEYIPKLDVGEPFILEPSDESPFMRHGHVAHGETVPAIYNNLYRAPLFRHKPAGTDFLVIRSTTKGESKYFIRDIKNLFAVGQTFPVTEVPGPHSRKITNTIKGRLQLIAFRLLGKSKEGRVKIQRLLKYFPDENEMQMKQRLKPFIKEFMEFHRTGPHQNYWRLKTTIKHPSKAEMLRIVEPEHVVLSEGMIVGSQHLMDAGYGKADFLDAEKDDEEALKKSIEQQVAPWMITKSFVSAATKGTLMKLHGDGDPTGRGEAFSFIRASAKTPFVRAGEDPEAKEAEIASKTKSQHKYTVADQQAAYRSEVDRIWKAQHDSLSNPIPPTLSDEEDEPHPSHSISRVGSVAPGFKRDGTPAFSDRGTPRAASVAFGANRAEAASQVGDGSNRVLRIRRFMDGKWRTEIIRDTRVIAAYLERKRAEADANVNPENVAVTGDAATDARNAKLLAEEIARLKKNQDRRLQRKNAQIIKNGGTPIGGDMYVKSETTRKCGNCGQVGHMKTNRKCPRWAEFNTDGGPISATSPPPTASASSPSAATGMDMSPPSSSTLHLGRDSYFGGSAAFRPPGFNAAPSVPSPLATSPPVSAPNEWYDGAMSPGAASGAPKKLTLKVKK